MQLIKCSIDGVRPQEKPATLFWAWVDLEYGRHSFRQRLCLEHFMTSVAAFLVDAPEERLHCPGCHIDIEDDYLSTYLTAYLPGRGREDVQIAACPSCTNVIRQRAAQGSESLPDRQDGAATPAPSHSAWETLADLGRTP